MNAFNSSPSLTIKEIKEHHHKTRPSRFHMVCCPIHLGQLFPSWADFKEAIQDWSIADKFQFKSLHKDRSRADIRCRTRTKKGDCPWRVYATITQKHDIKVKILEPNHNCQRAERAAAKRETCNSQSWLKRHVPKHLIVTRETRPEEIQDVIKSYYGVDINYQAANDVKNTLSKQYKVKMVQPNLPAYLYPPHIDPHPNNDIGVWFKDASAAYLGRDSRQANSSTTTSNSFKRFFQQNSCIPSPSTIDTKDGEFINPHPLLPPSFGIESFQSYRHSTSPSIHPSIHPSSSPAH